MLQTCQAKGRMVLTPTYDSMRGTSRSRWQRTTWECGKARPCSFGRRKWGSCLSRQISVACHYGSLLAFPGMPPGAPSPELRRAARKKEGPRQGIKHGAMPIQPFRNSAGHSPSLAEKLEARRISHQEAGLPSSSGWMGPPIPVNPANTASCWLLLLVLFLLSFWTTTLTLQRMAQATRMASPTKETGRPHQLQELE